MDALIDLDTQLLTSAAFIAVTMALGEISRQLIKTWFSDDEENSYRLYLLEIAMQFERVATTGEIFFILGVYGPLTTYVLLVLRNIWQVLSWEQSKSNTHSHVLRVLDGTEDLLEAVGFSALETFTSIVTYPLYLKPFWRMFDNQPDRWAKAHKQCATRMKGGLLQGSMAEGFGGFTVQFVGLVMAVSIQNKILRSWIQTTMVFCVIVVCFNISGGYFNPPAATAAQMGCENVVIYEHFICYWLAPITGAALGAVLYRAYFGYPEQKQD